MEKKDQESFEVKDKRRFVVDSSGEAQGEEEAPKGETPAAETPREEKRAAEPDSGPLPQIDFATFVLSLSSSALLHLGLVENPVTKKVERNLSLAKQTIDIIVMLRDKTKGNVTPDEGNLLENLLADLRMKYVNEVNR